MAQDLQTIVQRMIEAGESEDDIALVIKHYKPPTEADPIKPVTAPAAETKPVTTTETPKPKKGFNDLPWYARALAGPTDPISTFKRVFNPIIERNLPSMVPQLSGEEPGVLNPSLEQNPLLMKSVLPETQEEPGIVGKVRHGLYENLIRPMASPLGFYSTFMVGNPAEHPELPIPKGNLRNIAESVKKPDLPPEFATDVLQTNEPVLGGTSPKFVPKAKPKVRLNEDGTYTNLDTGEILDSAGKPVAQTKAPSVVDETGKPVELGEQVDKYGNPIEPELAAPTGAGTPQFNPRGKTGLTGTAQKGEEFDWSTVIDKGEKPPTSMQEYIEYVEGKPRVSTGPLNPDNVKPAPKPLIEQVPELQKPKAAPKLLDESQLSADIPVVKRKPPEPPPEQSAFSQIWNAPRSLQSIDLPGITSAALRQSRPLSFTGDWFRAWGQAYKAFGSKEALKAINDNIKNSKYFKPQYEPIMNKAGDIVKYVEKPSIAESLGVKMTDIINTREEALASSLAERIPGYGRYVSASNRAYHGFLNDLRKNKFEQIMDGAKALGKDPEIDLVLGKKIADFVNNATGRGSLRYFGNKIDLEPIAEILGDTLYSPRALSARLAFTNPYNYTKMTPIVRKEYWKGLARIGVSWGAFTGLASLVPGVEVSLDPNNADFGKIRIGNTRIDPGAGWQQLMVLFHRELPQALGGGGTVSSTGEAGKPGKFIEFGAHPLAATRLSLPARYMYNQLNPSLRFVFDMLSATNKQPFDLTDRSLQMILPMYATDIAAAAEDDDVTAEFFAPLLSSMGAGVQTYDKNSFGKPQVTPAIEKATGVKVPTVKIGR